MLNLHEAGDTIVEVLIVIAMISLVLVGAFITSNRSLKSVQDAQEHGTTQTLVTSQLEDLKSLQASTTSPTDPNNIFTRFADGVGFCIYQDTSSSPAKLALYSATDATHCTVDSGDHAGNALSLYSLSISRTCDAAAAGVSSVACNFAVRATWPSIIHNSTNNVTMYYRLYRDMLS